MFNYSSSRRPALVRCWWLMPVILATLEAEIGRIAVSSQSGDPISKIARAKWMANVAHMV
jgi:hypothetical protein